MFASKKYVQGFVDKLAELVVDVNAGQARALHREIARLESRIAEFEGAVARLESRIAEFEGAENSASSKSTRVIWLSEVPLDASQIALVKIIRAYCGGTLLEARDLVLKAMQAPSNVAVVLDPYVAHTPKLDPNYVAAQLTELGCAARVVELK